MKFVVASNSIRNTVKIIIERLGIMKYVDLFVSNQDVMRTKPFPEMYWKCMTLLNALPKDTVIIEDSELGRQGARDSGAHLLGVESRKDVNQSLVTKNNINTMKTAICIYLGLNILKGHWNH